MSDSGGGAPFIRAEDLHKTYVIGKTSVRVLRGASLAVQPSQSVAVVGLSGAGKSTLLHILGGLDRPERGRVDFDGQDFYALPASRRARIRARRIGFVFQSYHLLPEMDVVENVMLPAMALDRAASPRSLMRARAMELLGAVGLAERAAHTPMELSGGEQQRAALARALMNDPDVVLADEPTGNLDPDTGRLVLEHLLALTRKRGRALVMVTHNHEVAASCDRVLRLSGGVLSAD